MIDLKLDSNFQIALPKITNCVGFTWIKGKNGSGKTTLLRILSSKYGEKKLKQIVDDYEFFSKEAALFVEEHMLIDNSSIESNISLFEKMVELDENVFDELSKAFNLNSFKKIKLKNCSSGERKKLLITLNMSQKSKVYFLDEPLANLDTTSIKNLETFLNLKFAQSSVLFYSSHQPLNIKNNQVIPLD